MQGLLGALGVQKGPKIIRGAAQRGIATVSAGIPCQAGAVQAGYAPLQLERAQVPHLTNNHSTYCASAASKDCHGFSSASPSLVQTYPQDHSALLQKIREKPCDSGVDPQGTGGTASSVGNGHTSELTTASSPAGWKEEQQAEYESRSKTWIQRGARGSHNVGPNSRSSPVGLKHSVSIPLLRHPAHPPHDNVNEPKM